MYYITQHLFLLCLAGHCKLQKCFGTHPRTRKHLWEKYHKEMCMSLQRQLRTYGSASFLLKISGGKKGGISHSIFLVFW